MNPTVSSLQAGSPFESSIGFSQPLAERAYAGLHAEILEHVLTRLRTRGPVLDLGCGTGAWLARLQQQGFTEVTGTDRNAATFGLDRNLFVPANLDQAFSHKLQRRFDVITAIETLEQVESPSRLLHEARQLINPGGYLFVTATNVEAIYGNLAERTGWKIEERVDLLRNTSRASVQMVCQIFSPFLKGAARQSDCHLFILRPSEGPKIPG